MKAIDGDGRNLCIDEKTEEHPDGRSSVILLSVTAFQKFLEVNVIRIGTLTAKTGQR